MIPKKYRYGALTNLTNRGNQLCAKSICEQERRLYAKHLEKQKELAEEEASAKGRETGN